MADAARYHRLQLLLTLLGLGVSLAYLLAVLVMGGGHAAAHWAARVTAARWGQVALVALLLGAGHGALGLPITLVRGYWLPRRFGLLHQPLRGWLADRLKAMLIGGALGLAAVELVYALLELTPLWWLVAAAVFLAAQVAMTAVLPVWIVPLFYRMAPLADDGLRERLLALARRAGVAAIGVFVADQSRKSRTANAAVVGLAGPADPAGLPWLALVALALGLVQLPLGNGFSRWIERQADDFALATTGNSPAFVGAMERLARLNLAERQPNRLKEIVLYSHPALERRIARARGATMDRG